MLAWGALACSGARLTDRGSKPPPVPSIAPTAVLTPTNGCPRRMAFTWSPDGDLTLVCQDIVHRLDESLRERSAFLLEKGEPVIDIAHGTRGGPFWIVRADGTVLTLNIESHRELAHFRERTIERFHDRMVFPSEGGQRVAVLVEDGIAIRDLAGETRSFVETTVAPEVAWSPDATRIAFWKRGSGDEMSPEDKWLHDPRLIAVVKVGAAQPERAIAAHPRWMSSLRFSADGRRLTSTMADDIALVAWDLASGEKTQSLALPFEIPEGERFTRTFSRVFPWNPSNAAVLLPDESGVVRLPALGSGIERHDFGAAEPRWADPFARKVERLAVSPPGDFVAAQCESPPGWIQPCVWDLATGERRQPASPAIRHTWPILQLEGSSTGDVLVTSAGDYELSIWDLARGSLARKADAFSTGMRRTWSETRRSSRSKWSLSPDGKRIVVVPGKQGAADIHETSGGITTPVSGEIWSAAIGETRLYTVAQGSLSVWTLGSSVRKEVSIALQVEPPITLSPDGTRLALGGKAGEIEVRSTSPPFSVLAARKGVWSRENHPGKYRAGPAFSADSRILAVTQGHDVSLWDTGTDTWRGPLVRPAHGGTSPWSSEPTFSSDGRTVRISDTNCVVWSFDVNTLAAVGAASICDTMLSESPVAVAPRDRSRSPRPATSLLDTFRSRIVWTARWFASASEDGSVELRRSPGSPLLITLRAISGLDAGYVFTPDGHFDLVGGTPELARPYVGCSKGGVPVPLLACEALHTPELLAQVITSLPAAAP